MMGPLAERYGVRTTVVFGAVSICIGLMISTLGQTWQLYVGHGVFIGLFGTAGLNAPLYIYVSRWFDRRRGSALALLSSGLYLAGTVWPPVFERSIAHFGWQATMMAYGLFVARRDRSTRHDLPEDRAGDADRQRRRPARRNATCSRLAAERGVRDVGRCFVPVLRDHVDATEPLGRALHRPRLFGAKRRRDALAAPRPRRARPAGLGRDRRPDRRAADASAEFGVAGPGDDRLRGDARRTRPVRRISRVRHRLQRADPRLCARRARILSRPARRTGACPSCCCSAAAAWRPAPGLRARSTTHFGFYAPAFAAGVASNLLNFIVIATLVLAATYIRKASLRFDAGLLDDRPPFVDFGFVPGGKRLRRQLIARRHLKTEIVEPLLHRRIGHRSPPPPH